jgi:hypothetical protein
MKMLQMIFDTFTTTLTSMMNIGGLMLLLIFIYAVIGMNLFAEVKFASPMTNLLNFNSVGSSFLTLLRISTGENWNELFYTLG